MEEQQEVQSNSGETSTPPPASAHRHDTEDSGWRSRLPLLSSLAILAVMLVLEFGFHYVPAFPIDLAVYVLAYLLGGYNVLLMAFRKARRLDIFNEFFLMSVATIGAFAIGEYSEGVAVMIFYSIGEWFQDSAVDKAKRSIKALLDIRPDKVTVIRSGTSLETTPKEVQLNEIIQIKAGEKVALDGELLSERASFNTAALTGESKPDSKAKGDKVFAGMVNLNTVSEVRVTALFKDSKLSRILEMVQDATARKSQTQLFISRFAKIYTPIVFALALAVCFGPAFFQENYDFREWFYRSLVFLVISCPCALVVSIPLGYFGGIGLASRNGILFKGGNYLDVMTKVDTIVMDKTGTLTKGVFKVQRVEPSEFDRDQLIRIAAAIESKSTHPVGKAIIDFAGANASVMKANHVQEIPGHGLKGDVDGKQVLAGNSKLLSKFSIATPPELANEVDTLVVLSVEGKYAGFITIADEIKEDAKSAVTAMHAANVRTVMLSGDKQSVVDKVARVIGIDEAFGDLLPEDKVAKVKQLKDAGKHIAFAGDGVNDAPVVALADVGIAMGGLGSDATIETADVVIQNDQPSKIVSAIRAGEITRRVVWQNITLAMTIKVIVLALGAGGLANLWEAVIADVGVALIAILNAARIQRLQI